MYHYTAHPKLEYLQLVYWLFSYKEEQQDISVDIIFPFLISVWKNVG